MRRPTLLVLFFTSLLVASPALSQLSESLEKDAKTSFRAGKFKDAAAKYHEAAANSPDTSRKARMELQSGYALFNDKNTKAARDAVSRALSFDPELEALPELFVADFVRLFDEVKRSIRSSTPPAPPDIDELKRVAAEKLRDGRADEVIYDLSNVPADKRDDEIRSLLDRAYAQKSRGAPTSPVPPPTSGGPGTRSTTDPGELLQQGRAALVRGDFFAARASANRLVEAVPTSSEAYKLLGDAHLGSGEKELAEANWKQSLKLDEKNEETLIALSDFYLAGKDWDGAVENLRRAVEINPKRSEKLGALARKLRAEGDLIHARQVYAAAASALPGDTNLLTEYGALLTQLGEIPAALEPLGKAAGVEPKRAVLRANLAAVYRRKGSLKEAEREYREALATEPEYVPALNGLGALLLTTGNGKEAAEVFAHAAANEPRNAESLLGLARAQRLNGDLAAAAATLEKGAELENGALLDEAGAVACGRGRYAEAVTLFGKALVKDPTLPGAKASQEKAQKAASFMKVVEAAP